MDNSRKFKFIYFPQTKLHLQYKLASIPDTLLSILSVLLDVGNIYQPINLNFCPIPQ